MDEPPRGWNVRTTGRFGAAPRLSGWPPPYVPQPDLQPTVAPEWATPDPGSPPAPGHGARRTVASAATFVLVAGVAAAAFTGFRLFRAPADSLTPMVPGTAAAYATAYLQPSGDQQLALSALMQKFPVLADGSKRAQWVDSMLDSALQMAGLDHQDVLPWLGGQIGMSLDASMTTAAGEGGAYGYYISTTDPSLTAAALQKWQNAQSSNQTGITYTFTSESYQGITITTESESLGDIFPPLNPDLGAQPSTTDSDTTPVCSYAIVGATLVMASSTSYLEEIIDTDQGRRSSLQSSSDFQQVLGQLPADRLGLFYLDYPALVQALQSEAGSLSGDGVSIQPELDALAAYRGMGVSAEAEAGGLAFDAVTDYDPSQMSADQRAMQGVAADQNAAAGMTPQSAVAFYGFAGSQDLVHYLVGVVDQSSSDAASYLAHSGLGAFLGELSGDFGAELDQDRAGQPAGAVMVGTTDPAATRQFLDTGMPTWFSSGSVVGGAPGCDESGEAGGGCVTTTATLIHESYRGADISEMALPDESTTLAWTVTGGEAVIATSPAEVRSIIDTRDGGPSLAQSRGYAQTPGQQASVAVGYVDISKLTALIDQSLPDDQRAGFEQNVVPNLRPISSISMTVTDGPSETQEHVLIEIP